MNSQIFVFRIIKNAVLIEIRKVLEIKNFKKKKTIETIEKKNVFLYKRQNILLLITYS